MTTTHTRPFVTGAEHWRDNRRTAASVSVYPARMTDPEGAEHPGVAVIVKGRPFLLLTPAEADDLAAAMSTAAASRQ